MSQIFRPVPFTYLRRQHLYVARRTCLLKNLQLFGRVGGSSMEEKLIEFKNVSFRYDEDGPWVLNNCSFSVYPNEWLAIIGHNGSGKSTIAKLMNGLLFPQQGEIMIHGQPLNEETVWEVRKDVGMVFQNPDNQFVGTTVQDDIAFGMENRGFSREKMVQRTDDTLAAVDMEDFLLTEPHRLSGGQKQRVAIAGVLAISPEVIILDEATAMLDPNGKEEIMNTISRVQQELGLGLITITHDLTEVVQAERVLVLNQGEIWREDVPRAIFANKQELEQLGLALPFISLLTNELNKLGLPLTNEPMDHEEFLEDLWTLHSKM